LLAQQKALAVALPYSTAQLLHFVILYLKNISKNMHSETCPTCGSPLIQKNKTQLTLTGIVLIAISIGSLFLSYKFWPLAFFLLMISVYLIAWSWLARGLWCRKCKSAPFKKA
jgi:hypothetical protein